ncbi:MAG TPA: nucleotidyltransferase family protein [Armatimonadota bacterium]|nr:nucleotidyltransferase family protein [Armatimonadota bacterium]
MQSTTSPSVPADAARALVALCGWFGTDALPQDALSADPEAWAVVDGLARRHGVLPALCRAARVEGSGAIPEALSAEWKRTRLTESVRGMMAKRQLSEIAARFHAAGLPWIPLKGGAALLWVYERAADRKMCDLDLLVEEHRLDEAAALMRELGYQRAESCYTSVEAEQLNALSTGHLCPYSRPGALPVEIHWHVLKDGAQARASNRDIWRDAVTEQVDGVPVRRLSWPHFLLHTAFHYGRHLEKNHAALKGLVDLLRVLREHGEQVDWPEFWDTAYRWDVADKVAPVMRTLEHYWGAEVQGIPSSVAPLPEEVLAAGVISASGPAHYAALFAKAQRLPTLSGRARYLFRLMFPQPAHLRYRYGLPEGAAVTAYYPRHLLHLLGRAATRVASVFGSGHERRR